MSYFPTSGKTGTGVDVAATSPALVTPALGTPASGNLANCTGYPASGVTGVVGPASGGTGVANNVASTLTISGNFATTLTVTGATGVTLPTSGTLATLAGVEELTNKTLTSPVLKGTATASGTFTMPAFTLGGTVTMNGQTISGAVVFNGALSGITTLNASGLITASSGITFGGSTLSTYVGPTAFSPTLKFGGGSTGITYGTRAGKYWRIGNQVFLSGRIILTSKGSSTGGASIDIPGSFTSASNGYGWAGALVTDATLPATFTWANARVNPGQTTFALIASSTAGGSSGLDDTNFTNTTYLDFSVWFEV